jgi:hypothetical protein
MQVNKGAAQRAGTVARGVGEGQLQQVPQVVGDKDEAALEVLLGAAEVALCSLVG